MIFFIYKKNIHKFITVFESSTQALASNANGFYEIYPKNNKLAYHLAMPLTELREKSCNSKRKTLKPSA